MCFEVKGKGGPKEKSWVKVGVTPKPKPAPYQGQDSRKGSTLHGVGHRRKDSEIKLGGDKCF